MNDEILMRFIGKQCSAEEIRKILRTIESCDENRTRYIQLQSLYASADILSVEQNEVADPGEVKRIISGIYQ